MPSWCTTGTGVNTQHRPGVPLKTSNGPLVSAYDCAMLDLDGVVYVGPNAVDRVPEVLAEARRGGMTLAFVTNNASRPPAAIASHLQELGVSAQAGDVVTSAQAAAREVAARVGEGSPVLVVGGEGLVQALQERGLVPVRSADDDPVAVVQGFDRSVGWEQLAEGAFAVREGATWVASNLDLTVPTARGIAPGNGTLVRAVAAAVGRDPDVVAGKPFRPLFDETVRRIASQRPLVVGDRLDTDIEGAVTVEADSLLVMTGVTDVSGLCRAEPHQRPSYVSWTLDGLLRAHQAPTRRGDGAWELSGWVVRVDGGSMEVVDKGQDDEAGLAAVTASAWDWLDAAGDRGDSPDSLDLARLDGVWGAK
jgi:glycerol-1-phosphatase